jgi:tetratricopeptide (TPR) repeat protein
MAQGSKEHRMVFDIRGRRRHVVKVVYAILAILMAASLFLVTGAINLNSILGTSSSSESAASSFEKQAENIEAKLVKEPGDEDLLASLTRTRVNAGNSMVTNGAYESTDGIEEVEQQYAQASQAWSEYLKASGGEPSPGLALQVSPALFALFEIDQYKGNIGEALESVKSAAEVQKLVAEARPSLNSWSTLSFYYLFAQEYKAAEKAKEEAAKFATTKFERESFENKYEEVEKNARILGKQAEAEKAAEAGAAAESAGKEKLGSPVQGLGGTGLGG